MTPASSIATAAPRNLRSQLRQLVPLFIGLTLILAVFAIWTLKIGISSGLIGRTDFRGMYAAGVLERTHPAQLYSLDAQQQIQTRLVSRGEFVLPFFHPGYEAFLFVPFSLLPYSAAYLAFVGFNAVLMGLCVLVDMRLFSVRIPYLQSRPGLSILFFAPIWLAILQGQDSILFLLLLILVWKQIDDKSPFRAGLLLAAALFKFQLALPLACFLALRHGGRFVRGFLAGAAGVVMLSFAASPQSPANFAGLVFHAALAGGRHSGRSYQGYIFPLQMGNLRGLIFALGGSHLSSRGVLALTLSISIVFLVLVAILLRRIGDDRLAFSAALLACFLTSYHLYPHDLTPLLLPILLIASSASPWSRPLTFGLYFAPFVFFFLTGASFFFLVSIAILLAVGALLRVRQPRLA